MEFRCQAEYEQRHATVEAKISALEARLHADQGKLRDDFERKFDKLTDKVDKVAEGIRGLRNEVYQSRNQNLKWVVSAIVSFLLGGGALEFVRFLMGVNLSPVSLR